MSDEAGYTRQEEETERLRQLIAQQAELNKQLQQLIGQSLTPLLQAQHLILSNIAVNSRILARQPQSDGQGAGEDGGWFPPWIDGQPPELQ